LEKKKFSMPRNPREKRVGAKAGNAASNIAAPFATIDFAVKNISTPLQIRRKPLTKGNGLKSMLLDMIVTSSSRTRAYKPCRAAKPAPINVLSIKLCLKTFLLRRSQITTKNVIPPIKIKMISPPVCGR